MKAKLVEHIESWFEKLRLKRRIQFWGNTYHKFYRHFVVDLSVLFSGDWQIIDRDLLPCILFQPKDPAERLEVYVPKFRNKEDTHNRSEAFRMEVFLTFLQKEDLISRADLIGKPIVCFLGDIYLPYSLSVGHEATLPVIAQNAHIYDFNSRIKGHYVLAPDCNCLTQTLWERLRKVDAMKPLRPYKARKPQAFWRGRSTGCVGLLNMPLPREQLCDLSNRFPDLLDAKIVEYVQGRRLRSEYYNSKIVSLEEHTEYAIIIDIDGNACTSDGLLWRLYSGSVVLKVDSMTVPWYHPYLRLRPFEHYVPVRADLGDLTEKIEWCKTHVDECEKIASRAAAMIAENFQPEQIVNYFLKSLRQYRRKYEEYRIKAINRI